MAIAIQVTQKFLKNDQLNTEIFYRRCISLKSGCMELAGKKYDKCIRSRE